MMATSCEGFQKQDPHAPSEPVIGCAISSSFEFFCSQAESMPAQAESRFGEESKSPRADGQCKVLGSERPGSAPFGRGVQVPARGRSMQSDGFGASRQCPVLTGSPSLRVRTVNAK